jgi:ribosome biogenesis protein ERB1
VAKYKSGSKFISSIAVHPKGDNFVLGTFDKKVIWFDMDMGSEPYKVMKYNEKAIRSVSFH